MNVNTRLTVKFLTQICLLLVTIFLTFIGINMFLFRHYTSIDIAVPPSNLLEKLPAQTTVSAGAAHVSEEALSAINQHGGWLQILNSNGDEIYQYHTPAALPTHYAPGQLVYYHQSPNAIGYRIYSWYDVVGGVPCTWLYGTELNDNNTLPIHNLYVLYDMTGILIVVIGMSLLFGRHLGMPVLHILNWLKLIAAGSYLEPTDAKGTARSRHAATGLLKRSYRLYQEVIEALEHLATVLKRNEDNRNLLEKTREEWITGVSHDLKTPLSSVKGYADLLSASHYKWTEDEIHNFGRVIAEKASFMEELMDDLSLTFRLKNNALPLQRAPQNVVELVRRSVIDLVNHPSSEGQHIQVHLMEEDQILYPLDPKWFKRAIDNLLANASQHNPAGTTISVRVESLAQEKLLSYPGVLIEIVDNGKGMDEQTVQHLFDRYYRGTNSSTPTSSGSGLGTAIAKQLIEAHGGTISVYSRPNEGTSVIIGFSGKSLGSV